jgi:chromosome segregation ATPase
MKNNHIQTAIKALNRQLVKLRNDRDKFEVAEQSARQSKEFFEKEIAELEAKIVLLEAPEKQKELELT